MPMNRGTLVVFLSVLATIGCEKPPPAPEGLDESSRYMIREFYNDDSHIGAGLTGFLNWYDEEGYTLLDSGATVDEAGAFALAQIQEGDIGGLPIPDDGRDLGRALGTVSLADMPCDWTVAEQLLARSDQDIVFEGDFLAYDREYVTSRQAFEGASADGALPAIAAAYDPFAADFDAAAVEAGFMMTDNTVTTEALGVTMSGYHLILHFRHGTYVVQEVETEVSMILAYLPTPVAGDTGGLNEFKQSYSVEINIDREGRTLRMFSVWAEVDVEAMDETDEGVQGLLMSQAINRSQDSAQRLSDICAGDITVEAEQ